MTLRLALAGTGLIGRRHAEAIAAVPDVELSGIADPDPAAVIRGEEPPLVPAREALENLRVIDAARRSAETGLGVTLHPFPAPEGETP